VIGESKENILSKPTLFYNARIYTMAGDKQVADSMVIRGKFIEAVGVGLQNDEEYHKMARVNLKGKTVVPGLTDSHTHFIFMAISLDNVKLDGLDSLEKVLDKIKKHAGQLKKNEWVVGEGFQPARWKNPVMPDRFILDKVTGGRPAAIFSKDQHMMWANSRALEMAGLNRKSPDPEGGRVLRFENNEPIGIMMEIPGYFPVVRVIAPPTKAKTNRLYKKALALAYSRGVTGVHTMDGPEALDFYTSSKNGRSLGLRVTYYPPPSLLSELGRRNLKFNSGNDYIRIGGIKIFSDGSLGSQTALCFNKYKGSKDNYGVEVTSVKEMTGLVKKARKAGYPCAIHAIGDRAVANVLEAFEKAPKPPRGAYHRIEHLQMIRRKDIARLRRLGIIASMQPSHCPSDIKLIEKYWGGRGRNCYIFRTLIENGIPLIFGSDAPIEPLNPIGGISDAVNRTAPRSSKAFYPEERITNYQALHRFTASPWESVGRGFELGRLLPGYFADFVLLSDDIVKSPRKKIDSIRIDATYFDGREVYRRGR